jgi:hypothetical protein
MILHQLVANLYRNCVRQKLPILCCHFQHNEIRPALGLIRRVVVTAVETSSRSRRATELPRAHFDSSWFPSPFNPDGLLLLSRPTAEDSMEPLPNFKEDTDFFRL